MVDMILIRQEGINAMRYADEIDLDNIQARKQQWRKGQHKRIDVFRQCRCITQMAEPNALKAHQDSHRQDTGIAHEDLFVLLNFAKYIVIIKGDKHACGRESNQRI